MEKNVWAIFDFGVKHQQKLMEFEKNGNGMRTKRPAPLPAPPPVDYTWNSGSGSDLTPKTFLSLVFVSQILWDHCF